MRRSVYTVDSTWDSRLSSNSQEMIRKGLERVQVALWCGHYIKVEAIERLLLSEGAQDEHSMGEANCKVGDLDRYRDLVEHHGTRHFGRLQ